MRRLTPLQRPPVVSPATVKAVMVSCVLAVLATVLLVLPRMAQAQVPPQAGPWRGELVRVAHATWGLDAPVAALAAQVQAESGWNARAVSHVGAQGMAQFMPQTAAWWCRMNGLEGSTCEPANPRWALRALVGYDAWLYERLAAAGAEPDRLWATLRAYNGGLGHWNDEARQADGVSRQEVDAACGKGRRAPVHCAENLAYPRRILVALQPRYAGWGRVVEVTP